MIFNRIDYSQIDEETYDKLPRFAGAYGEDIYAFLEEFYEVCVAIKPRGVRMEEFKFKIFPLCLDYHALSWYTHLWLPLVNTYREFERGFVIHFATPSQQEELRIKIASIQQSQFETFEQYYERFLRWMRWCPDIGLREGWLLRYFLNGLIPYERRMMDVMAGGSILDCELDVVWDIYDARADATMIHAYSQSASMQQEDNTQSAPHVEVENCVEGQNLDTASEEYAGASEENQVQSHEESIQQADQILDRLTEPEVEPPQLCLNDTDVVEATSDPGYVSDEELQVVLTICNEEFKAEPEDVTSSHCSDLIAVDNEVTSLKIDSCTLANNLHSFHAQEQLIERTLGKARKRRKRQEKWLEEDGTTVRSRKRIRTRAMEGRNSSRFPPLKSQRTKFGWKPGWSAWSKLAPEMKKHKRAYWGKYDGVHPWAPNL